MLSVILNFFPFYETSLITLLFPISATSGKVPVFKRLNESLFKSLHIELSDFYYRPAEYHGVARGYYCTFTTLTLYP